MNTIKRFLGWIWMLAGPALWIFLVYNAINHIDSAGKGDISKPLPWIIIITIFTPIAVGFVIFGWYAWKGEYDRAVHTRPSTDDRPGQ
ncbi:MAG TPA: hypothetical protein VHK91_16605 [Flavisolibacter sp.]|jgi:fatty acid desaturase|nr:hypothetical protein [Flavisolibacter sp.]